MSESWGDEVYRPDGDEPPDFEGLLDPEDTLVGGENPLEEGYVPRGRPLGSLRDGVTVGEGRSGESLDARLAQERPDPALGEPPEESEEAEDAEVP
ncbi:hypothetical protein [Streptacidiphilus sp. MAP5-3]|uniref:hypothetical protein n=1 Tax=unclassified Streptacidiphilus TaxID=2643834 RepID=UPI0035156C96